MCFMVITLALQSYGRGIYNIFAGAYISEVAKLQLKIRIICAKARKTFLLKFILNSQDT